MTHVFIVRLWREGREISGAAATWRGTIEHVATGEQRALGSPDDVCRVIRARLGATPTTSWWRRFGDLLRPGSR